jgi:hypothetical protein
MFYIHYELEVIEPNCVGLNVSSGLASQESATESSKESSKDGLFT